MRTLAIFEWNFMRFLAGLFLSLIIFSIATSFLQFPDSVCSDGWKSLSIGTQGACSYHGGVRQNYLFSLFLVVFFVVSFFIGYAIVIFISDTEWIYRLSDKIKDSFFSLFISMVFFIMTVMLDPSQNKSPSAVLSAIYFFIAIKKLFRSE